MSSPDEVWSFRPRLTAEDEFRLRRAGKDLSALLPSDQVDNHENENRLNRLAETLESLLSIAVLPDNSASQRAAVINPLCAIIEASHVSPNEVASRIVWERNVWNRLFTVFLERSDTSKAKSMRQVLVLLTSLLNNEISQGRGDVVRMEAVEKLLDILFFHPSRVQAKSALQALDHFLQKKILSIPDLLTVFLEKSKNLSSDARPAEDSSSALQRLLRLLLDWVSHNDSALAAGHLTSRVVSLSQKSDGFQDVDIDGSEIQPFWSQPLVSSIRDHHEQTPNYHNYVFPGLFKLDINDYFNFLVGLGLYKYLGDDAGQSSVDDPIVIELLFASLQSGKELGLVQDVDYRISKSIRVVDGAVLLSDNRIGRLLGNISSTIRISALSLLVSSSHITRAFTPGALRYLQRHFHHLVADIDANFRAEFFSLFQRLLERLRAVTHTLDRDLKRFEAHRNAPQSSADPKIKYEEYKSLLDAHYAFITWMVRSFVIDLRPTGPYQRRITTLKVLLLMLKVGLDPNAMAQKVSKRAKGDANWPRFWTVLSSWMIRSIMDMLMDPFDDIRHTAAQILKTSLTVTSGLIVAPNNASNAPSLSSVVAALPQFLDRAESTMLLTGRADHADGVARTYELLCSPAQYGSLDTIENLEKRYTQRLESMTSLNQKLREVIEFARKDMALAVSQRPMHGILASMKYILDQPDFYSNISKLPIKELLTWRDLHATAMSCLYDVWDCVKDVLCNDAPEGHIPDELEGDQEISTKDILSYSWRALKEASSLLRVIIANSPFNLDLSQTILTAEQIESAGKLCFIQLSELRHRGAFSTVAQTFGAICLRCTRITQSPVQRLPEALFEETMLCIQDKSSILTRRSGGIPALIVGIVAAAPEGPLLKRAMDELYREANLDVIKSGPEENRLPQVHALNCLKDIFMNSKLGEASEPYIGKCLNLAASKLESNVWWIRNCGLMLFRALIDRLLGYDDLQRSSQQSIKFARISYDKYPGLLDAMVGLLKPQNQGSHLDLSDLRTEAVFPVLQILQRAPPPLSRQQEISGLIISLARSKNWHVRVMAAKTFVVIQEPTVALANARMAPHNQRDFDARKSQNEVHGNLLILKHSLLLHRPTKQDGQIYRKTVLAIMESGFEEFVIKNQCPITKAAYFEALSLFFRSIILSNEFSDEEVKTIECFCIKVRSLIETQFWNLSALLTDPRYAKTAFVIDFALLRQSMAQSMLHACVLTEFLPSRDFVSGFTRLQLSGFLRELAVHHPESCKTVLEDLSDILGQIRSKLPPNSLPYYIRLYYELGCTADSTQVRSTSFDFLGDLMAEAVPSDSTISSRVKEIFLEYSPDRTDFEEAPSLNEGVLKLAGIILEVRLEAAKKLTPELAQQFSALIKRIQCSLHDDCEFPRRYAAAQALSSLRSIWRLKPKPKEDPSLLDSIRMGLIFCTYQALNDDDDEIRDLTSEVATRIIASRSRIEETQVLVPLLASQQIAEHLSDYYSSTSHFYDEALRCFMGQQDASFGSLLANARHVDTSLFVKERQNLFVDETRESLVWSRVLIGVTPESIGSANLQYFSTWVMDGLKRLTEVAQKEFDGPLGWVSKPEVFTLGMRAINGAEVLLRWREKSRAVSVKGSEIRRALWDFVGVGQAAGVHEMWLDRADKILTESVARRLARVNNVLEEVIEISGSQPNQHTKEVPELEDSPNNMIEHEDIAMEE